MRGISGGRHATTPPHPASQQVPTRRRDRKQQILTIAADLFLRNGYAAVSMSDIAAAAGITPGALYRHYEGKNDILTGCIESGLEAVAETLAATESDGLDAALAALAKMPDASSWLGELWGRDLQYLPITQRAALRRRMAEIEGRVTDLLHASRPELSEADADLLSWAVPSVFASVSYYRVDLPLERVQTLLYQFAYATVKCSLAAPDSAGQSLSPHVTKEHVGIPRRSRRERLLTEASRMFDERGYAAVSMEDIGTGAGISSALIYHHFDSKADLLFTASLRAVNNLEIRMTEAFDTARSYPAVLQHLSHSYVDFAVQHRHIMNNLVTATSSLPQEQNRLLRVHQRDFLDEWILLLTAVYPTASYEEARCALRAALNVVHNTIRTPHLVARRTLTEDLEQLVMTILGALQTEGHSRVDRKRV